MRVKDWFYNHIANAITIVNLISGVCAVLMIMDNKIILACYFIVFSMVADGIDGKVAFLLKTSSNLGKQLDSLCDVISFGLAPALLVYQSHLSNMGFISVVVTSLFVTASVVRLARYNTMESYEFFKGLPITIAGGFIISLVLVTDSVASMVMMIIMVMLSILMVSSISYSNFKHLLKEPSRKLIALIMAILVIGSIIFREQWLVALLFVYIIQGLIIPIYNRVKRTLHRVRYKC